MGRDEELGGSNIVLGWKLVNVLKHRRLPRMRRGFNLLNRLLLGERVDEDYSYGGHDMGFYSLRDGRV